MDSFVLTSKAQAIHYLVVTLDVCALQIVQHTSALRDHLKQASSRMIVLLVNLEMLGEFVDSLA